MYIDFIATGQELRRIDSETVASNSIGFLHARFQCDEVWTGLTLKAVFKQNDEEWARTLEGGECVVPAEVLLPGRFKVWLVGENEDKTVCATTANVVVVVQTGTDGARALAPGIDDNANIAGIIDSYLDEALDARVDSIVGEIYLKKTEIDTKLSTTSTNPVQNRIVTEKIAEVETTIGNIDALLGTI